MLSILMHLSALSIREIVPGDAAAAALLSGELGYPMSAEAMEQSIISPEIRGDEAVFVACVSEQVVGWIDVVATQQLVSGPRAEIAGLIVSEEVRSRGVGRLLVARAEEWAASRGMRDMLVRSRVTREDAHRFYLREGYSRNKTSAVFVKKLP